MSNRVVGLVLLIVLAGSAVLAQNPPARSPTETMRQFYQLMREKKFREAFLLSIYRPAKDAWQLQSQLFTSSARFADDTRQLSSSTSARA